MRIRLGIAAALLAILAASNRVTSWRGGIRLLSATDSWDYRRIALAAPHLPSMRLPNQHAQVFPFAYLVGLVAHGLGVSAETAFRAAAVAVILGIVACLHLELRRAGVGSSVYAVAMALFVLNTYSLRYYLIASGIFLDLVFVLGTAIALRGLIAGRYWIALTGAVVGMLARQTALVVSFAFAWWVAFGAGWRLGSSRLRTLRALGMIAVPAVVYAAMILVSASFSRSTTPGITGLTILGDLEHLPGTLGALAQHVVRVANPLFAVGILLSVALLARVKAGIDARLPFQAVGCLVVAGSIAIQPLLLNTGYSGHPERLTVLSLLPFVLALAHLLRERERQGFALSPLVATAIVAVLWVGSLHYLYTPVGPATAAQGAVLQLLTAIGSGVLLWMALSRGRRRRAEGPLALSGPPAPAPTPTALARAAGAAGGKSTGTRRR